MESWSRLGPLVPSVRRRWWGPRAWFPVAEGEFLLSVYANGRCYGGGYYDRFLAFYPGHKVGLCRRLQLSCAELPHDDTDVSVDFVVTEAGVFRTNSLA